MVKFQFIDADELLVDSFELGRKIYESGFIPTHAVSLWRGGTPIGLGVGEFFRLKGHFINHTTFATASYTDVNSQSEIIIKGLEHLIKSISKEDRLLIIDDIYDSGKTIDAVIKSIKKSARANNPDKILVACVHYKEREREFSHEVLSVKNVPDVWLSYPHEIADLVDLKDPDDKNIKLKSENIYNILHSKEKWKESTITSEKDFIYLNSNELLEDSLKLAKNIYDDGFIPDFILAIWPGGINSGLPIHEYFKYRIKKENVNVKIPDHISINTALSHLSYKSNIIGVKYLEDNIESDSKILIIDTVFGSGRLINQTIDKLKELLRRNISVENIKIASVYYNPSKDVTWTTVPTYEKPHYNLYNVKNKQIIFPYQIHRLPDPYGVLSEKCPEIRDIIYKR